MSRSMKEGCIASCVRYFLLTDHTHTWRILRRTPILTATMCGVVCNLLLSARCCPYREWASLVSCLVFSILAHTSLQISTDSLSLFVLVYHHRVMCLEISYYDVRLVSISQCRESKWFRWWFVHGVYNNTR